MTCPPSEPQISKKMFSGKKKLVAMEAVLWITSLIKGRKNIKLLQVTFLIKHSQVHQNKNEENLTK